MSAAKPPREVWVVVDAIGRPWTADATEKESGVSVDEGGGDTVHRYVLADAEREVREAVGYVVRRGMEYLRVDRARGPDGRWGSLASLTPERRDAARWELKSDAIGWRDNDCPDGRVVRVVRRRRT